MIKDRSIKELLILMLDNINKNESTFFNLGDVLYYNDIITISECQKLSEHIKNTLILTLNVWEYKELMYDENYFINYLKTQINKL
jgi:hypothetical protein